MLFILPDCVAVVASESRRTLQTCAWRASGPRSTLRKTSQNKSSSTSVDSAKGQPRELFLWDITFDSKVLRK